MKEQENKKTKRLSIQKKTLASIVLFAIVLVITTGTLVCVQYYKAQVDRYSEHAFALSRAAAGVIDGDRVLQYVETGEKDEYYESILEYLNVMQVEEGLKYYYVFVPYEDDLVYVWDANAVNKEGACDLGVHEKYMSDESKAATFEIFTQDPPEKISVQKDEKYGFIASAYSPIFNSAGEPVAVAAVDLSMSGFIRSILLYILLIMASIIGVTLIAQSFFYKGIEKNIIKPIRELKKSSTEMVGSLESDEAIDIDIHTGDELEDLADAITKMDGDLRKYIRELSEVTAEKERVGAEMNIARRIQSGMLPSIFPAFPERNEFDLYASMEPAKEVGGDFYDFFMVDDDHMALVMADVSGKGVPAALFMVVSKILIKNAVLAGHGPSDALKLVNERLLENNETDFFVTVWLAVIDINTGKGHAANAGHEHPALRKAGNDYELVKYKHSPAVGTMEGINFREHEFELGPGDTVFVYTDGVTEATNENVELFGEERMIEALNKHKDCDPADLLPAVKAEIDAFVGNASQFDDITMLAFRYNGKA